MKVDDGRDTEPAAADAGDDVRVRPRPEQLRPVPLFGRHGAPGLLDDVAARMRPLTVAAGDTVCREGEVGTAFYLVEDGTLSVSADLGGRRRELARLGAGQFFGEIALLGRSRRSATVTALTETHLWSLSAEAFSELLAKDPDLGLWVAKSALEREHRSEALAYEVRHSHVAELMLGRGELRVGRDPANDIVLGSPRVSPFHAVVQPNGSGYQLVDLDSTAGTFVNGARVRNTTLKDGDELWFADERLLFEAGELVHVTELQGVRIDARGLCRDVKDGTRILHDVSLTVLPGELVALVGGSGAGKSTLLDALSGVRPATSGQVQYNGRDYYAHLPLYRRSLGYVPQDDIVHTDLPLRRTLLHAARLRLPLGTSKAELEARVDATLEQLSLTGQGDVKVANLSGGQRKRCSIGVELLTRPRVFFLDEPTSGLDPATDGQMMRLLRQLADQGDTVVMTTHATKHVMLCDKVVIVARGGHVTFVGPPERALEYFDTKAFDEIYERLEQEHEPRTWAERFESAPDMSRVRQQLLTSPDHPDAAHRRAVGRRAPLRVLREALHQYRVLSAREADISLHSKSVLVPMIVQPLGMTALLLALFPTGVFDDVDSLARPLQLVLLLTFTSFLVGLLSGVLAIVKEVPVFLRERMVGVGTTPYLLSKLTFLGPAVALRAAFMLLLLRVTDRLPPGSWEFYWPLLLTTVMVGLAALSVGLLTSALARTSQQATDVLSLWIIPQVLFSGALFAVPSMNAVGRWVADLSAVRWAFELNAQATGLLPLFEEAGTPAGQALYQQYRTSFTVDRMEHWVALSLFVVVPLAAARLALARRGAPR